MPQAEQDAMIERDNAFHAVARHERSTQNAKEEAKRVHEQLLQRRSQAAARRSTSGRKVRQAGVPKAAVPAAPAATNRSIKRPRRDLQPIMESDVVRVIKPPTVHLLKLCELTTIHDNIGFDLILFRNSHLPFGGTHRKSSCSVWLRNTSKHRVYSLYFTCRSSSQ